MRVLHVLNHTGRLNGNVHAAVDLACAQSKMGNDVTVASGGGHFDREFAANGVQTILVSMRRRPLDMIAAVQALSKLIKQRRFHVVHAHMETSAVLAWPACALTRTPLVTTVHNEFERSAILMGIGRRVIAVSAAVAESMERRGLPASRIRTVLNGTIGTARHPQEPSQPQPLGDGSILFVGGLHPRKGLPTLLHAFSIVKTAVPCATLHVVGEGPHEAFYQALAAKSDHAGSIIFYGGQDDPRPWFLGADIFSMPSLSEPAGLVLSEASEAGCAIVASNVGGIPEMLDGGRAGVLVPPQQPEALAAALIKLLTDPAALARGKQLALANASRLSLERVVRQTNEVYQECF